MAKKKNADSLYGDFAKNATRKFRSRSQFVFSTPEVGELQYIKNGLYQKICNTPAQDAMRNGYEICDANEDVVSDDNIKKINEILFKYDIDKEITNAVSFSRATGGAVVLLQIDDGKLMTEELDENNLKKLYGVKVYNAVEALPAVYNLDYSSEDFMKVIIYNINDEKTGKSFQVHSSRLLIFDGLDTVGRVRSSRNGWGGMVFDNVKDELSRYDSANRLSISILSRLSQGILKVTGLQNAIVAGDGDKMTSYIEYMDSMRSIMNTLLLDSNDDFDLKNMTLSGYKDIIEQQEVALSAVSQIPITILFGRSPAGMNATGEADLETYYSLIKRIQNNDIQKNLERIINIISKCKDYKIIEENYHIKFNEVKVLSEKDKADISNKKADSLTKIASAVEKLHALGAVDNDEIAEYLDKKTDFTINHEYGTGE